MEILHINDDEKKEECSENLPRIEKEKVKAVFSKDSDNFIFFFKLPLLLKTFLDGLEVRAPIEDLKSLKQYLSEIYVRSLQTIILTFEEFY